VRQDETGFAEFYRASHQRCLRAVIAGAGRPDLAEDLVAEAFTRALVSWRTVRDHPAPEAANGVPALLHFGGGPCSADHAPRRGPVGLVQVHAAGGHITLTMTFKVSLWPAGSELYIANGPLGPQPAVIPQGHYQGCA
jgi:hypothetical protein